MVFCLGALIIAYVGRFFFVAPGRRLVLYAWHTLFCLVYCWYVLDNGGDAVTYYSRAVSTDWNFSAGTRSIETIAAFFIHFFGLSFLGVFLVFNIFGTVGLLAFDGALKIASSGKVKVVRALAGSVVFLPSVNFWTAALGKDALAFLATGLALWSAVNLSKRAGLMFFAVFLMFLVRPHIAGIMVLALLVSVILNSRVSPLKKFGLAFLSFAGSLLIVPFALSYAGLDGDISINSINGYIQQRQSYNTDGGGGVDIASMTLPMQLFTYLFRPMLFEASNLFEFAAALDNLVLLLLFFIGCYSLFRGLKFNLETGSIFISAYALGVWLILSMTTANMGIALRQKWMFVPMIIFLIIAIAGRSHMRYVRLPEDNDRA